jgi:hypothetical protein
MLSRDLNRPEQGRLHRHSGSLHTCGAAAFLLVCVLRHITACGVLGTADTSLLVACASNSPLQELKAVVPPSMADKVDTASLITTITCLCNVALTRHVADTSCGCMCISCRS